MRLAHGTSIAALATLAALGLCPSPALAQAPTETGFGGRDSFVFSIERVLGFQTQEFGGDGDADADSLGLYPLYWGNVGLFKMQPSGLNFGTTLGLGYLGSEFFDSEIQYTIFRVGPRIGYAGSTPTTPWFGYWVRGGPSTLIVHASSDDPDPGEEDDDAWGFTVAASLEAYAVITAAPHVSFLIGPHADIHLFGDAEGEDFEYSSYGLTLGILGEFW